MGIMRVRAKIYARLTDQTADRSESYHHHRRRRRLIHFIVCMLAIGQFYRLFCLPFSTNSSPAILSQ